MAADNPNLTRARWKLAAVLVNTGKWDRALALLAPLEEGFPNQFEVIAGLGFAHYFKRDFARALDYLERAMTLRAPDTSLLNALGDSYERLGRSDKARETYERSLELDPGQKVIQERLQSMKKATDPEVLWPSPAFKKTALTKWMSGHRLLERTRRKLREAARSVLAPSTVANPPLSLGNVLLMTFFP